MDDLWERGEEAVILGNAFICNKDIRCMDIHTWYKYPFEIQQAKSTANEQKNSQNDIRTGTF